MDKQEFNSESINRYLRGELSEDEESAFEIALLDSPELQEELQTSMAIREVLRLESIAGQSTVETPVDSMKGTQHWQPLAMAASVLLAIFSTTMYWKVSNETSNLQEQLDSLRQPSADVMMVSIDIMRSSGERPQAIIQKPATHTLIVLDIELGAESQEQPLIRASLVNEAGAVAVSWSSEVRGQGSTSVALFPDQLPNGRSWLEITNADGKVLERRLLEFLPAQGHP